MLAGDRTASTPQATYDMPADHQVGRLARRGVFWSGTLTVGRQILSLAVTAILARLLTPGDYGLIGMVATLTALAGAFSDIGLSWATVQRKELSAQQIHNLFWVNSAVGFVLWGICVALGPLIANFYSEPKLTVITIAMGSTFAIGGFAVQPLAVLQRQMQFGRLAVAKIGSAAIGSLAAIALAFDGWGYWALVGQALFSQLGLLIFSFVASRFRPARPRRAADMQPLLRFGGFLALNGLLIYLAFNLDNILIGRFRGTIDLGYYTRAYSLMIVPTFLVTYTLGAVMVPALSALQHDTVRFGDAYRKALRLAALIGCPLAAGLGLTAPEAVRLLYGPRWSPVEPILVWLAIVGVLQPIYDTQNWLFIAAGKGRSFFCASFGYAAVTGAAFVIGIQHGALGVAQSYAIAFVALVVFPVLHIAHRAAGVDFGRSLMVIAPILAATALMAVFVYMSGDLIERRSVTLLTVLGAKIGVGIATYSIICAVLLRDALAHEILPHLQVQPIDSDSGRRDVVPMS